MTAARDFAMSSLAMLHINNLSYRIEGRLLLDAATAAIPEGHKVGLVGRNGTGKTTLLKLICAELAPDDGSVSTPRNTAIGRVAQEAPGGPESLIEWVLDSAAERKALIDEAEHATDPHRIAEIHIRLSDIDAHTAPARAAQILAGLGFDEAAQARPCSSFSGGWRMRLALGAILFQQPRILLLDEPTNYLDLEGTLWLENYLRSYPGTVLIVSHDRDLLNNVCGAILHLEHRRLTLYAGGYDRFEGTRRERQRLQLKLRKRQDDERRRIQSFIDRFRAKATKASQAQSRIKTLEKMQPIAASIDERVVPFDLPQPKKAMASPLFRLEDVTVGYTPGQAVLRDISLRIDNDDRIALLGQNGNGKSTFAKLIAGKLEAMAGRVYASKKISVGYFAQHQSDELNVLATPYDYIANLMPDATEAQKRARLGTLGFGVDKADTKCANLSGGEKARLLLALATFDGPNLLILDEPTNHLDIDSREALIHALNEYEGAIILISHDRHLVEASADRLWIVRNGTVTTYDGNIAGYRTELLAERQTKARAPSSAARKDTGAAKTARADKRRAAAEKRAQLAPLKKKMLAAEKRIEKLNAAIGKCDGTLSDASFYDRDPEAAQALAAERGRLAKDLLVAEDEWLQASERLEQASVNE